MRVLVVRHHEEDMPGLVGEALEARGATIDTHLYGGSRAGAGSGAAALPDVPDVPDLHGLPDVHGLPDLHGYDHLVILGSSSSVYESGAWIAAEIDWLRTVSIPVLGICFGAQLLSATFGGAVERSPVYELGWVRVEPVPTTSGNGSGAPTIGEGPWFQFHGDRCVVPPSSRVLAKNDVGVQAFTIGSRLGVQFHPEVDVSQLERWIDSTGGRDAVVNAGKDPDELLEQTAREEPEARARADELVGAYLAFTERVTG